MIFLILKDDFFNRGLFLGLFFGTFERKVSSQGIKLKESVFLFEGRVCKKKVFEKGYNVL